MSRPHSEALTMQPVVLYITYATLPHEKTSIVMTFEHSKKWGLVENGFNAEEYE